MKGHVSSQTTPIPTLTQIPIPFNPYLHLNMNRKSAPLPHKFQSWDSMSVSFNEVRVVARFYESSLEAERQTHRKTFAQEIYSSHRCEDERRQIFEGGEMKQTAVVRIDRSKLTLFLAQVADPRS